MTTFTKGQSISFRRDGKIVTGKVEDVSTSCWGVRMEDRAYYAVYERDLVEQTPATKAGLNIGDIVVVGEGIKCPHAFRAGEEAVFKRDDRSHSPLFEQDGQTQYLDLSEITIGRKVALRRTPSEIKGLKVGDEVLMDGAAGRGLSGRIILCEDDRTTIPRFRDEHGNEHYASLSAVTKAPARAPAGPCAGVLWSEAPVGATHYSMMDSHRARWHKLDEAGNWFWLEGGQSVQYRDITYAYVASQVAIPGVVVEVNPLNAVLAEVKALETQIHEKLATKDQLNRQVARLNIDKQSKLDAIHAEGFKIVGDKLVKTGKPVEEWKTGDKVKCIKREGSGLANIVLGGVYKVVVRDGVVAVIDGDGDPMRGCVSSGCFEFHEADLSSVPTREWKAGDVIRNVSDHDHGYSDITIGQEYTLLTNADSTYGVRFRDNAGDQRRRDASEYVLVRRKA